MSLSKRIKKWLGFDTEHEDSVKGAFRLIEADNKRIDELAGKVNKELSVLTGKTQNVKINVPNGIDAILQEIVEMIRDSLSPELRIATTAEGIMVSLDRPSTAMIVDYLRSSIDSNNQGTFSFKIGAITAEAPSGYTPSGARVVAKEIRVNLDLDMEKSFNPPFKKAVEVTLEE